MWVAKMVRGVSLHFLAGGAKRSRMEKDFMFYSSVFVPAKANPRLSMQKITLCY